MKITQEQIYALWRLRLFILKMRKPGWIIGSFFLPGIVLIIPFMEVGFYRPVVLWSLMGYGAFFLVSMIIFICERLIKSRKYQWKYSYHLQYLRQK